MTPVAALFYIAGALGYALAATGLIWGLGRLAGRTLTGGMLLLMLSMLFVIFLGVHPFPDRAALDCQLEGKSPNLELFGFLEAFEHYWQQGRPLGAWLRSKSIMPPVMNVLLFAPVGLVLRSQTRAWWIALGLGLGLSLFIEIAQLTGLYGFYACAYRQFELDDLILNSAGVLLGFALADLVWRMTPRN